MKPIIAALIAGTAVFLMAYHGAQWGWMGSTAIAVLWAAMAYVNTYVLCNPEPRVRR